MNITEYNNKTFEDIKHIDEKGVEFWYARGLADTTEKFERIRKRK